MENKLFKQKVLFGLGLGSTILVVYLIYKAIGDYQTSKRIENMDENLAKLSKGESYKNKLLDKVTLKEVTGNINKKINDNL